MVNIHNTVSLTSFRKDCKYPRGNDQFRKCCEAVKTICVEQWNRFLSSFPHPSYDINMMAAFFLDTDVRV